MKVRTVIIESNGAPLVINESDFRYGSDRLWDSSGAKILAEAYVEAEVATSEAEENDIKVTHKGGGRWIVTVNGKSVHKGTLKKAAAQALAAEY